MGERIRAARLKRGWTQADLAAKAGIGRMVLGRAERGVARLDLEVLERIALALEVPLLVEFGRDRGQDLADAGHLAIQELVLRLAKAAGFEAAFEQPTRSANPWLSADVGLASPARREAIEVECWNSITDLGAATRSSTRKLADVEAFAVARWGGQARAGLVWVVRATARNRELVARYPEIFATRFPGSSRAWIESLTAGAPMPWQPGLVWCDVGARRLFEWRPG